MQFKDIIGQESIKNRFIQSVKDNRISHAQLLLGPEGCGKLALAIAYAQYISCENRGEDDSCGVCPSCVKYQKLIHPDLHFVFPVIKSTKFKDPVSDNYLPEWREIIAENPYFTPNYWYEFIGAEKKQGLIYAHESSEIIRKLNLKTYEAEYKVMIIWLPEKMNPVASNKMLKLLEEPPAKTLFLLVSENSGEIIQTILSRTQLVKIPKISESNLKAAIQSKYTLPEDELDMLIHLSDGNYVKALNNIDLTEDHKYHFELFTTLMRNCYLRKVLDLLKWVDEVSTLGREKQKAFLEYSLRMVRENFVLNIGEKDIVFLAKEEAEFSKKFSPFINEKNVMQITEEISNAHYHIERNGYSKIVLTDMILKLVKLINPKN